MDIFPNLNLSGIWTLAEPFQNDLIPNVMYTCLGVRLFADVVAAGVDPYAEYYEARHQISFERYEIDQAAGAAIVTLQASNGTVVHVPNTYIISWPATGGVPYRKTTIALKLGALPKSVDVSVLLSTVVDAALDKLGVIATASVVVTSLEQLIDQDTNASLETSRLARKTSSTTDLAKYIEMKNFSDAQAQKILQLEAALKSRI